MIEVYYYIPDNRVSEVVECGMKLSEWYQRELLIGGELKKCICALLNPKDDTKKYRSENFKCVKLELPHCYVADKYLYEAGKSSPALMDMYIKSIIDIKDYRFGMYRLPECLVTGAVISDNIKVLDKRIDSPVLFDNSEKLYVNNIIEENKEYDDNFFDCLLYNFYCKLAEIGKVDKIEDAHNSIVVFFKRSTGQSVIVRIPEGY